MKITLKKHFFTGILIATLILFFEFFLQVMAFSFAKIDRLLSRSGNLSPIVEGEELGYRSNLYHPDHDENGFRNEKVPESAAIVALGDSQTYGTGCKREEAWPQQLDLLSGKSIYNMALPGFSPAHSLIFFEQAVEFKPELIIVAFYAGNDCYDAFNLVYIRNQLHEFKSTSEYIAKKVKNLVSDKTIKECTQGFTKRRTELKELSRTRYFLSDNSRLYGFLRLLKRTYRDFRYSVPDSLKKYTNHRKEFCLEFNHESFETVFTPNYRLCALDQNDIRILEGHRIALKAIRTMSERAAYSRIDFTVLLIPTKELVFKNIFGDDKNDVSNVYFDLIENEEIFWQKTKSFLEMQQIHHIDSLPALRKVLDVGQQPYRTNTDGHPNEVGYHAIAELVLAESQKLKLFK